MRKARIARPLNHTSASWFYVGPDSLDIFLAHDVDGFVMSARLTRKQVLRAAELLK
jgi:hypothetical protein